MKKVLSFWLAFAVLWAASACRKTDTPPQATDKKPLEVKAPTVEKDVKIDKALLASFAPLPDAFLSKDNPLTPEKIDLGRMLYYDTRLSKNHDVSCNTCHDLEKFGVDNEPLSPGHRKQLGKRNSPTVYNSAGHFVQFWDGSAPDVEAQALMPILDALEMAMPNKEAVVAVVRSIPGYVTAFQKAFPNEKEPITFENIGKAIGAFERKLLTHSRWDKFLKGDEKALTNAEKRGFIMFVQSGCTTCHMGALVGATMYQKLGLVKPWPNQKDLGRYEITKNEGDKMFFKVPSLRDVEKTWPYLHDGSIRSLGLMTAMMAEYSLGRTLTTDQINSIIDWMKTLTGEIPKEYIAKPELPPNGPNTPKPDPT